MPLVNKKRFVRTLCSLLFAITSAITSAFVFLRVSCKLDQLGECEKYALIYFLLIWTFAFEPTEV